MKDLIKGLIIGVVIGALTGYLITGHLNPLMRRGSFQTDRFQVND